MLEDISFDQVDQETSEIFKEMQSNANGIVVFPWVLKSGFVNNTERGYVSQSANPSGYSFFETIFTGKDNIQVLWENSTKLKKPEGVNRYNYQFKTGKYYLGAFISGQSNQGVEIDTVTDNDDFLAIKDFQSVKLRFDFPASTLLEDNTQLEGYEHCFFPKEEDRRKFYTIPELCGNKWLMITDITMHTGSIRSDIVAVEIEFSTIGDKLKKSGRATEQFIQYGGAGDCWCLPTIKYEYDENGNRTKKIGYERNIPTPVTHLQVEMLGAGAISGITVWGRKLKYDSSTGLPYFTEYKFLLPYKFYTPQNNDINRTGTPSKSLYFFPSEAVEFCTSIDWDKTWKEQNNSIAVNNLVGKLSMGVKNQWNDLELGLHKSNNVVEGGEVRHDYFDEEWYPTEYLGDSQPTLSCNGNMYTEDTLTYRKDMNAIDILVANSFAYLNQLELPLGYKSSKPYRISNLPIIGGLVSAFIGDRTINPNTKERANMRIGYFIDSDLAGRFANRGVAPKDDNSEIACFVNNFCGEDIANWLGVKSCNLSFCFELTDKININSHGETKTYDTKYIGQDTKEDGTYIFEDQLPLLFNTNEGTKVQESDDIGFVIDKVIVQGLFAGKVRFSAYNIHNDNLSTPVWTTSVISTAKWTESIRNWTTEVTCGGWDDRFIERYDDFTWPKYPSKKTGDKWSIKWVSEWDTGEEIYKLYQDFGFTKYEYYSDLKLKHSRENTSLKTFSINYNELGITGVTDKASFMNTVKAMKVNYFGTEILLHENGPIHEATPRANPQNKTHYIPITSDNITTRNGVVGIAYGDDNVLDNATDSSTDYRRTLFIGRSCSTWICVMPEMTWNFGEEGITLTISDISFTKDSEELPSSGEQHDYRFGTKGDFWKMRLKCKLTVNHIEWVLK